jgi:hypothetical protein
LGIFVVVLVLFFSLSQLQLLQLLGPDYRLQSIIHYEVSAPSEQKARLLVAARYLIQQYQLALGSNITMNLGEIIVSDPQHNPELKKWATFGLSYPDRIIVDDSPLVDFNYNVLSMELAHHFMMTFQKEHPSKYAYNDWNNLVHFAANHGLPYVHIATVQGEKITVYNFWAILHDQGKIRQEIIKEMEIAHEGGPNPINSYWIPVY